MVTLEDIATATAEIMQVSVLDMRGKARQRRCANARQVCYLVARQKTDRSLPQIGRYFGGRDHTTVIKGITSLQHKASKDPELAAAIQRASDTAHNIGRTVFIRHETIAFTSSRSREIS